MGAASFRGHEFHYSDVSLDPSAKYAYRLSRGIGIKDNLDGAIVNRTLGSYTHLHPVASLGMMKNFVKNCRKKR
jgi:cobyrinic acid a,c-diamide synthase